MTAKMNLKIVILVASIIVGVSAVIGVALMLLTGESETAPETEFRAVIIGEPVSIELPAEEAATVTHDSGARIEIPAGATTESTTASVAEVEPPISFVPVGRVFDFSVGDVELARPVTIHIPFELGPDDDISQVQALHWNETQAIWEPVAGTVDSSTMTVAVTTSELSWFTAIANKLQTAWDSLFGQERSQTVQHTCWTEPRRIPESNQYEEVEEDQQRDIFSEVTNISEDNNIFVRFEVSNPHFDLYEKQQTGSVAIPIGASRTFKAPVYTDYADGGYIATCTVVSEGLPGLHLDLASHTIPFAVVGPGKLDLPPDDRKATFSECWPGTIDQKEPSVMYDTIGPVHMHGGAALRRLRDQTEQYLAWYYIYKDGDNVARAPKEWELLKIGAGSSGGTIAEAYQQLLPGVVDAKEILGVSLNQGMGIELQDSGKYTYRCTLYSQNAITDDPITALSKIPQCHTRERLTDSLCISKTVYEAIPDWHFQSMRTGYFCIKDCTPGIDTGFKVDGKDIGADTEQSIEIGKTVTLSFELGGLDKKAEHGGITVSFPNLTWPSSEQASYKTRLADVSTANSAGEASGVTYYDRGDIVWRYRGDTIEADHLMVESYEADLQTGAERTLELTFTPYVAGDYQVLYRSWLCGEEYQGCLREPTASSDPAKPDTYDQQEWETYSFTIKVREPKPDPLPPPPPPVVVPPAPDVSDREALVALYQATDGSGWKNNVQDNQPWLVDNTASAIGDWYGVTTFDDKPNRVKYLIVEENCLEGRLPEAIGGLSELQLLILQWNSRLNCDGLTGQIPPSLSNLTNLWELDLSENRLSGTIPDALGNLASLEVLDLSDNRFSGEIPSSLGSLENLYAIDLRNNRLEGQIPDKLAELPNLEELYLSGGRNEFMGCIPAALFDIDDHDLDELGLEPCGDDEDVVAPVTVQFSEAEYTVNEDAGEVELTVTLSEPLDSPVNVVLRTTDGTAESGLDYDSVSTTLSFPANTTSQKTTVRIIDDQMSQGYLYFSVSLDSSSNPRLMVNTAPVRVTIREDEIAVAFDQSTYLISESRESVTIQLEVVSPRISCPNPDPFVVHFSYTDPFGVLIPGPTTTSPVSIPFDRCDVRRALSFQIHNDNVVSLPRWVEFTLDRVTSDTPGVASRVLFGKWSTARLEIIDQSDRALVEFKQSTYRVREGEAVEICAVLRDDDRVDFPFSVNISYTDRDGALSSGPTSFMFGALETESCVEFEIPHDDNARSDRYFVDLRLERPPDLDRRVFLGERSAARLEVIDAEETQITQTPTLDSDRAALIALYNATGGDNWKNNTGWLSDASLGEWYGVETRGDGRVTRISLINNRLSGTIPPQLGMLTELEELELAENRLTGAIPPELGNLGNLRILDLRYNQLSGAIPDEIGNLTKLGILGLGHNKLSGSIPSWLTELNNLYYIFLFSNVLTGKIPPGLGNLPDLRGINLDNNQLSGTIPPELGNLTKLEFLGLAHNDLSGRIPPELGRLANVSSMTLSSNQLIGCIPAALYSVLESDLEELGLPYCSPVEKENPMGSTRYLALEALYHSTDGDNWKDNSGWLSDAPLDEWYGVETLSTGEVTLISLRGNNLSGIIPPELGDLNTLEILWLDNNNLSGAIPTELSKLSNLRQLDLRSNKLSGEIPTEVGNLTSMGSLDLALNQLTGEIPSQLGKLTHLRSLSLGVNQLSGTIPIELGQLSNLEYIDMGNNQLSGEVPVWIRNLKDIVFLGLKNNRLSGEIPPWLGDLTYLRFLFLNGNNFTGTIPLELGNLTDLEYLVLSSNQLSGTIPPVFGDLSGLTTLGLSDNQLTGTIPLELGNLTDLEYLVLSSNQLSGTIPPVFGDLSGLTTLGLSDNQLTGTIPLELGNLTDLEYLVLSSNQLSGTIPPVFGDLSGLTTLGLRDNQLTGEVPPWLGDLTDLTYLSLSSNQFTGSIPTALTNLTNLKWLYLKRNQFTGCIPAGLQGVERNDLDEVGLPYCSEETRTSAATSSAVAASERAPDGVGWAVEYVLFESWRSTLLPKALALIQAMNAERAGGFLLSHEIALTEPRR